MIGRESSKDLSPLFWALSSEEVLLILGATENGLASEEAELRLKAGRNRIKVTDRAGKLKIFLAQFKSILIIILLFATGVTLVLGDYKDAAFIAVAVIVNVCLGFYQENKAENALAKLRTYIKERTRVLREGRDIEIDAEEVVPGDILKLSPGSRVAADARVIRANNLSVDEAILTGESLPASKSALPVGDEVELGDRSSMVFGGTAVVDGRGLAVVTKTGGQTELGKIAVLVGGGEDDETPLQKAIARFAVTAGFALLGLSGLLFTMGIFLGADILEMFLTSVAIAVAAVPEGLPIAMTVILAVGVERLAKRRGVVRKLLAAEALGSTTIILTDKTGTLTEAHMELAEIISEKPDGLVLELAVLNTDVVIGNPLGKPGDWQISGSPLDVAVVRAAALRGVLPASVFAKNVIMEVKPFNSKDKYAAVHARFANRSRWVYLGAPDVLLDMVELTSSRRTELMAEIDELAFSGNRVLGLAVDKNFIALLAFRDPVRPGVGRAIHEIAEAGVKTVIVTGDHRGTALAVANELGMEVSLEQTITGKEISALSDETLEAILPSVRIFARVSPQDKLRLVELYQKAGEVVAVTGDGVNDAPALKGANIGVAVGSGTDVAKGAADLIILDDNFETIVEAVKEGRRILENIKKVIVYLLSDTFDELVLIGGSILMGVALPINALQILWVNFFSDSFPAVGLAFEDGTTRLSQRRPTRVRDLMDGEVRMLIWVIGTASSALLFFLYLFLLGHGFEPNLVRTFIFASFSVYSLFLVFSMRSLDRSIFSYNLFSNRYLVFGVLLGFVLTAAAIYFEPLREILGTTALPPVWLWGVLAVGVVNIAAVEFGKWLFRGRK